MEVVKQLLGSGDENTETPTATRRQILGATATAATGIAGCLETDQETNGNTTNTNNGEQTEINAPEPDTLQDQPILYHGQTYQLNNEEYTVPDTLDRGPQTITTDQGQTIQAYINNAETYEESIAWQFERDDIGTEDSISADHHNPVENGIQVDGDTIYIETETETTGNNLSTEIAGISGVCTNALSEDNIPYNFEITVTDGNGTTYNGTLDSDMSQDYIDEEATLGRLFQELRYDMGF